MRGKKLCLALCLLFHTIYCSLGANSSCGPDSSCVQPAHCNDEGKDSISFRSNLCPLNQYVCCKRDFIKIPDLLPDPWMECGVRNVEGKLKVSNGREQEAGFSEFPWMVALFSTNPMLNTSQRFLGGGSILAPNVILTAAHTVRNHTVRDLEVRTGEWNMDIEIEPLKHRSCRVQRVIAHEQYRKSTGWFDIALLLLDTPLELAHHIKPICLPRAFEFLNTGRCIVAGWGAPNFDAGHQHRYTLRKVDMPVFNHSECQTMFRHTRLGNYFNLHDSLICAGGEKDLDACTGDGGSPLFCPLHDHPNQYFQLGIVAWGLGCHTAGVPGAYSNVFILQKWLHAALKELQVNPNYYTPSLTPEYFARENNFQKKKRREN